MSPVSMSNPADEISQKVKREVMKNDRLNTYQAHAAASVDDDRGGRFAVRAPATMVGQSPITYPQQPQSSPANQAAMAGDELSLGYSVEDMQPVGEKYEVEQSKQPAPTVPVPAPNPTAAATSGVRLRRRV